MRKTGFGTRVFNFIIDTLIVFGITYGINTWWDFYVMYWQYPFIPFYVFFFGFIFIYYTFFEGIFKRSPAKWLTISKVANHIAKLEKKAFYSVVNFFLLISAKRNRTEAQLVALMQNKN